MTTNNISNQYTKKIINDIYQYNQPLKIIFAGTPNFSAYHLKYLLNSHHQVITVLTQPDRPNQRNKRIIKSPVKQIAQEYNIPIIQTKNLVDEKKIKQILPESADLIIVVAYGIILPTFLLNLYPLGCINIHTSLLPKLRGAAPIQWTLLKQHKITGITSIQMNNGIDTGNILYQIPYSIKYIKKKKKLIKQLCVIGIKTLLQTLIKITQRQYSILQQDDRKATYATKITKDMGKIDFLMSAKNIIIMIKTLNPWPGTYIIIDNYTIKIHQAKIIKSKKKWEIGEVIAINYTGIFIQTKKNILQIKKIQIPGKPIYRIYEFIHGKQNFFQLGKILI